MANKTFYLDRDTDPLNPSLEVANKDELIKVYDDTADMESDISNIEDDEIVSCKGNDYEGVHVTDTVSNGNLNPVTSNAVYQAIDNLTQYNPNYVLGEIDTGATWIDGKHIYRNVIDIGALPNATRKLISYNITVDTVFFVKGTATNGSGAKIGLPSANSNNILSSVSCGWDTSNNQVWVESGANWSAFTGYLILEYTKTE